MLLGSCNSSQEKKDIIDEFPAFTETKEFPKLEPNRYNVAFLIMDGTFNTELKNIDKALLRPGRLLARKEFKKIKTKNLKKAAKIIGVNLPDDIPNDSYSIAELINLKQDKAVLLHDHEDIKRSTIGFGQ